MNNRPYTLIIITSLIFTLTGCGGSEGYALPDGAPVGDGNVTPSSGGNAAQPTRQNTKAGEKSTGGSSSDDASDPVDPEPDLTFPAEPANVPLSDRAITPENVGDIASLQIFVPEYEEHEGEVPEQVSIDEVFFVRDEPFVLGAGLLGIIPWNLETGEQIEPFGPGGEQLIATNNPNIIVIRLKTFRGMLLVDISNLAVDGLATNDGGLEHIRDAAISPDNTLLATASRTIGLRLWSFPENRRLADLPHDRQVHAVMFSPDSQYLLSGLSNGIVTVWSSTNLEATEPLFSWQAHDGSLIKMAFRPGGNVLATTGDDGMVRLWAFTGEGEPELLAEHEAHQTSMTESIAFSPDGRLLVTAAEDGSVIFRDTSGDTPSGDPLRTLQITRAGDNAGFGEAWVNGVRFSPDGALLGIATGEGMLHIWGLP